ncbi:YesL family protein [Metabacillus malikii]|uniref:Membrane protein YesL n=1 Tax=Metabacillus malikii TaxID=1504265 RepID=A0ABT9ZFZ3_9BACI|nr:DUF624 domain-containing protein [Metabacillus malikii]MDQ0231204.1 putative membrane protein YesL [Metabacillus malikii]
MANISEWYVKLGDWSLRLFILNLYWIFFTIAGLVMFGLFPATVALFTVTRKLLFEEKEVPIFRSFYQAYKKEFIRANGFGLLWSVFGILLIIDLRVLYQLNTTFLHQSLLIILYVIIALFVLLSVYILPVYVHFNLKKLEYIKYSFVLLIGRPVQTILLIAACLGVSYIMFSFPGIIPVFGASIFSFITMKIASLSFPKINQLGEHEHLNEDSYKAT